MNTTQTPVTQQDAAKALQTIRPFLGTNQYTILQRNCRTTVEEHEYFWRMLVELAERIQTMPKTYENDGPDPLAYLHYFHGSGDWYITEKDSDPDGEGQVQAFGAANLGFGAELGYISIQDLVAYQVELDLYWTPKPLSQIAKAQ